MPVGFERLRSSSGLRAVANTRQPSGLERPGAMGADAGRSAGDDDRAQLRHTANR